MVKPFNDRYAQRRNNSLNLDFKQIAELIHNSPEVNWERVKFFQELIANGYYQISSKQIAVEMSRY